MTDTPLLSIVVATTDVEPFVDRCIASFRDSSKDLAAEILVVDASRDGTRQRAASLPDVRVIAAAPGTLVPALWLLGLRASRGTFVAFSNGHCVVAPTWAEALVAGVSPPRVSGAGGAFALGEQTTLAESAAFFLRFSNFLAERWKAGPYAGDIAGDNAIYRREELVEPGLCPADGFWEVEVHRRLRERGRELAAVAGATATVVTGPPALSVLRERFRHGRKSGAWRARAVVGRPRVILAAPLVPLVLAARVARRIWSIRRYRARLTAAMPWLLAFTASWAIGEAIGAIFDINRRDAHP